MILIVNFTTLPSLELSQRMEGKAHPIKGSAMCQLVRFDWISQSSSHLNASSQKIREIKLTREISSKKLEDYLDPVLLSAVRAKIGGKRKFDEEKKIKSGYSNEFDQFEKWTKEEKLPKFEKNEAVDLQNDSDWIGDSDGDEGIFCNRFLQYEKTVLKRFKE
ncbi:Uncharacterized protein Adt_07107 [Abeliophyllum distichum]|uniref:Uncharacterized protein n=1 Tax=Abeliophyllum distichum TaxID=126358 RepID=A0ABD1V8V4_9LAMI